MLADQGRVWVCLQQLPGGLGRRQIIAPLDFIYPCPLRFIHALFLHLTAKQQKVLHFEMEASVCFSVEWNSGRKLLNILCHKLNGACLCARVRIFGGGTNRVGSLKAHFCSHGCSSHFRRRAMPNNQLFRVRGMGHILSYRSFHAYVSRVLSLWKIPSWMPWFH
jgi:hypothetical protein